MNASTIRSMARDGEQAGYDPSVGRQAVRRRAAGPVGAFAPDTRACAIDSLAGGARATDSVAGAVAE